MNTNAATPHSQGDLVTETHAPTGIRSARAIVVAVNSAFAGVGGLYLTTRSVAVVVIACVLAICLALAVNASCAPRRTIIRPRPPAARPASVLQSHAQRPRSASR